MYASARANPGRYTTHVLSLLLVAIIAVSPLFLVLPACGPAYLFKGSFPFVAPPSGAVLLQMIAIPNVARNCLPSCHLAAALLVLWNLRGARRYVRAMAGGYLACVVVTTLGFGEHYLIDLVVAVPYALAIQAACTRVVPFIVQCGATESSLVRPWC